MWFLIPVLFYAAPPSGLPQVLALGHGFPFDGRFGPPLAYWVAEIAFRLAGLPGVYALSQLCLIATYWCVYALGRTIVGETHAAMAVLLMAGISVFTVPTPSFGPGTLAMALWSAALLFYWRAVFEGRPRDWYAVGAAAALLLLTSYSGLVLLGVMTSVHGVQPARQRRDRPDRGVGCRGFISRRVIRLFSVARSAPTLA